MRESQASSASSPHAHAGQKGLNPGMLRKLGCWKTFYGRQKVDQPTNSLKDGAEKREKKKEARTDKLSISSTIIIIIKIDCQKDALAS